MAIDWQRLDDLFDEIHDRSETERESLLHELEASEPELVQELRRRLIHAGRPPDSGFMSGLHEGFGAAARAAVEIPEGACLLDRYTVVKRLGGGGMAEIYQVREHKFDRLLAMKLIGFGYVGHPEAERRFEAEARLTAKLQHPNIVPIHDVGRLEDGGRLYYVMEQVDGPTLGTHLRDGSLKPSQLLDVFEKVCSALAFAHARDEPVVHRDLKPDNVMVGRFNDVQVLDWGIAKIPARQAVDAEVDAPIDFNLDPSADHAATAAGRVLGTVGYMAPEQARGENSKIGPRTDVFSLGAMLCEILTGSPPYRESEGDSPDLWFRRAQLGDVGPGLRRLAGCGADADLIRIAADCLAADPLQRPADAGEVANRAALYNADVLKRAEDERVQRAKRDEAEKRALAERQKRRFARLAAVSLGVLLIVAVGAAFYSNHLNGQNKNLANRNGELAKLEKGERQKAQASDRESTSRLVRLLVADGWRAFNDGDAFAAVPLFVQALEADRANPEAESVHRQRIASTLGRCPSLTQVWFPEGGASAATFSPDGRYVLIVAEAGDARVYDVTTGIAVGKPLHSGQHLAGGIFSPDGKRILTWGRLIVEATDVARLWDASTGEPLGRPIYARDQIKCGRFSSDGRYVCFEIEGEEDNRQDMVYDSVNDEPILPIWAGTGYWKEIHFAEGSLCVLSVTAQDDSSDFKAEVWNLETGERVGPSFDPGNYPHLILDNHGRRVLNLESTTAEVRDVRTGRRLGTIRHDSQILHADLSPDGNRIVTVAEPLFFSIGERHVKSGEAQVWDAESGEPIGEPFRHPEGIKSAFFAAGGNQLMTRDKLQSRLWDLTDGQQVAPPFRHRRGLLGVEASDDARHILSRGLDGSVRLWDLAVTDLLLALQPRGYVARASPPFGDERRVEVSPDARRLFVNFQWELESWDALKGLRLKDFKAGDMSVDGFRLSPDGRLVAGTGSSNADDEERIWTGTYIWNAESGEVIAGPLTHGGPSLEGPAVQTALSFDPEGEKLVTGGSDGVARLWDAATGRALAVMPHRFAVQSVAFSSQGDRLLVVAATETQGEARLWDLVTGKAVGPVLEHPNGVRLAALSPEGERIALVSGARNGPTGSLAETSSIVEIRIGQTGGVVGKSMLHPAAVSALAFSKDGGLLAVACIDGSARVYNAKTGEPVAPSLVHPARINQVAFTRDGKMVICCSGQEIDDARIGEIRIWDAKTGEPVVPPLQHQMSVASFALDAEERVIATCGQDFVRLWKLSPEIGAVKDLKLWAALLSEIDINERGHSSILTPQNYKRAWITYREHEPRFYHAPTIQEELAWKSRAAVHSDSAGQQSSDRGKLAPLLAARRYLDPLLAARSKDKQLHVLVGHAYFHLKDWKGATDAYERSIELGNTDWKIRYHRGLSRSNLGDLEQALIDFDAILKEVQSEWDVYYERAKVHLKLGRRELAEADCDAAIAVLGGKRAEFSPTPEILAQRADVEMLNGNWQPWFTRGQLRQDLGRYNEAAEDYGLVIKGAPDHLWSLCNRGTCRRLLGDYDDALKDFEATLEKGLNNWQPYAGKAWIEARQGQSAQAAADYAQALRDLPPLVDVWYEAALAKLKVDDRKAYIAICANMHRRFGRKALNERLKTALVCILAPNAIRNATDLLEWCEEGESEGNDFALLIHGGVLHRQGSNDKAIETLRKAADKLGEIPALAARFLLASALRDAGKNEEAGQVLEDAVRRSKADALKTTDWTNRDLLDLLRRQAEP